MKEECNTFHLEDELIDIYLRPTGNKLELSIVTSPAVFNLTNLPKKTLKAIGKFIYDYAKDAINESNM